MKRTSFLVSSKRSCRFIELFNFSFFSVTGWGIDLDYCDTEWSYPTPEARGGSQEEQPHVQEAVAAGAQEGLEERFHVQGEEGWR